MILCYHYILFGQILQLYSVFIGFFGVIRHNVPVIKILFLKADFPHMPPGAQAACVPIPRFATASFTFDSGRVIIDGPDIPGGGDNDVPSGGVRG